MDKKFPSLPLAEVAARMKSTELNVLMHIKRGLLDGEERDGRWYVTPASLETFIARSNGEKKTVVCATRQCGKGCGSCG